MHCFSTGLLFSFSLVSIQSFHQMAALLPSNAFAERFFCETFSCLHLTQSSSSSQYSSKVKKKTGKRWDLTSKFKVEMNFSQWLFFSPSIKQSGLPSILNRVPFFSHDHFYWKRNCIRMKFWRSSSWIHCSRRFLCSFLLTVDRNGMEKREE